MEARRRLRPLRPPPDATGLVGASAIASGLTLLALSVSVRTFLIGLGVLSLGTSLFKSALSTLIMGAARRDEAGSVSGAMDAAEALCRVAAPIGGGALLEAIGAEGPAMFGTLLALAGGATLFKVAPDAHKRALMQGGAAAAAAAKKQR